jgi:hypothetical protein
MFCPRLNLCSADARDNSSSMLGGLHVPEIAEGAFVTCCALQSIAFLASLRVVSPAAFMDSLSISAVGFQP